MNCASFSKMLAFFLVHWMGTVTGRTQTPWLLEEDFNLLSGLFDVPREAIIDEIQRRTAQDVTCGNDMRDALMQWQQNITNPRVQFLIAVTDDENIVSQGKSLSSVTFLIEGTDISLGQAFFSTHNVVNDMFDILVDDITVSKGLNDVTVTKGDDHMTLHLNWEKGCTPHKGLKYSSPRDTLHAWYPRKFFGYDDYCATSAMNITACSILNSHRCEIERVQGDFCLASTFDGNACKISINVCEMTGIFREMSLITMDTPFKSVDGFYFEGSGKLGFVYPCIDDYTTIEG